MDYSRMTRRGAPLLLALIMLASCGGGDGEGGDGGDPPETFDLSGTIEPSAGSAVDGDVNDIESPFTPNDSAATAQAIPNPVALGGYVNLPGAGVEGRSFASGDRDDWFAVDLATGQTITLLIGEDGQDDDVDLELYDSEGNLIDASIGVSATESLTLSGPSGRYLVRVHAVAGASNYILVIGQPVASAAARAPRLSDEFVPGEIVVRFDETRVGAAAVAQGMGLRLRGGGPGRSRLCAIEGGAGVAPAGAASVRELKLRTLHLLREVRRRPGVLAADLNYIRRPLFTPNDPRFAQQWHATQIGLPEAWDLSMGGGVIVAVIDTGVARPRGADHPDLAGQLVPGFDFVRDLANAADGDGIDADPTDPGDQANPDGSSTFHGTHVTGTVVAAADNGVGVAGAAFSARVMPLRVLGVLGGTDFDLEQALRYAARLPNDSGTVPARRADIVNMSLGGSGASDVVRDAIEQARAQGVVLVAAAGNSGTSAPVFPAAYDGVIGVSAVDINRALAPYSSFGAHVDVAAPGGNLGTDANGDGFADGVISTGASDTGNEVVPTYPILQGTSMATPHAAGVIALMKAANPALGPDDVDNLLAGGGGAAITQDLGTPGRDDRFGHGLIDARQAVLVAMGATPGVPPPPPSPLLRITPPALNFGHSLTRLALEATNAGGGDLTVDPPSNDSGGWLVVAGPGSADGTGTYTATVDRSAVENDGIYTATVSFTGSVNDVDVPVIMQVATGADFTANAGVQFVLLVDQSDGSTVQQDIPARQADGRYRYGFEEVAPGAYQILSGTDHDNDGLVCDAAEACGAYLTLDSPEVIELAEDLSGLDFPTGFTSGVQLLSDGGGEAGAARRRGTGLKRIGGAP